MKEGYCPTTSAGGIRGFNQPAAEKNPEKAVEAAKIKEEPKAAPENVRKAEEAVKPANATKTVEAKAVTEVAPESPQKPSKVDKDPAAAAPTPVASF